MPTEQRLLTHPETQILYRPDTFDEWIIAESRSYCPIGLKPGDRVFDIGGHIGAFAARAKFECPQCDLASFEAEESNFVVLEENSKKHAFDAYRVAIVDDSLDNTSIKLYVNEKRNNALHSVVPVRGRAVQEVPGVGFKNVVLDNFEPTVIKCDIEGGEYGLPWQHLDDSKVRILIMELHLTKTSFKEAARNLIAQIESMGFQAEKVPVVGEKNWTTLARWVRVGASA